jgi:hypothetical protein
MFPLNSINRLVSLRICNVFPMRYELNFYILFGRNLVFKGIKQKISLTTDGPLCGIKVSIQVSISGKEKCLHLQTTVRISIWNRILCYDLFLNSLKQSFRYAVSHNEVNDLHLSM